MKLKDTSTENESNNRRINAGNAGIFVTNSRVHMVARYLAERGSLNIRLIGYDLIPESIEYLQREYIDFLISQSPISQGTSAVQALFDFFVYKKNPLKVQYVPLDIIIKENIDFYANYHNK